MNTAQKKNRRQQILEALATMLEASPGARITTAALAKQVGVSEAALYRHFPSKSKMYEGLIEFIEQTLFSQINIIVSNESKAFDRCEKILYLLLAFCERNPGITRLLTGDALTGETERLRNRIGQLFDRLETELRQILRDAELRDGIKFSLSVNNTVALLLSAAEGRIAQFVRSEFKRSPTDQWPQMWPYLIAGLAEA
ncbi:nucleoid occlusion factor SlmA [Agaribacterium haliotis]|uniref:nucleoid occlusion factor SlmA n=1 Tax=Agaribacterium haliotis TaxID=2013869 RepID=UPI000BB53269|nr:nucleoid occlusion factor SlmA [Agaribacterium haliotis]